MTSKCKRMLKLSLTAPAFDLTAVEEHNDRHGDAHTTLTNAAACADMSEILSCLSLGSWRDALNEEALRDRGITHVLNVAKEVPPPKEREAMENSKFAHKTIPLQDCHSQDIGEHFEEAFAFIQEAKAANGKVLVHCRRGISRSPAIVVGYLMRHEGYTYENAVKFVKERRDCISLNLAFRSLLEEYQPTPVARHLPNEFPSSATPENSTRRFADIAVSSHSSKTEEASTIVNRGDSSHGEDFGLSAPESELSTQPAKAESATWE